MPPGNSATRGAAWPRRGSGVTALVTMPPSASRSITSRTSQPKPAVPEARRTGFWKVTPNSSEARGVERGAVTWSPAARPDAGRAEVERRAGAVGARSEEHTSELQSRLHLVCRLLLEKKKKKGQITASAHQDRYA